MESDIIDREIHFQIPASEIKMLLEFAREGYDPKIQFGLNHMENLKRAYKLRGKSLENIIDFLTEKYPEHLLI